MMKLLFSLINLTIFTLSILAFLLILSNSLTFEFQDSKLFESQIFAAENCQDRLWGGKTEETTYTKPYCVNMAPDIPYVPVPISSPIAGTTGGSTAGTSGTANGTVTASSNSNIFAGGNVPPGCTYYYKDVIRWRQEVKKEWVYEPVEKISYENVQETDPLTGTVRNQLYKETTESILPWLHQKENVVYIPEKVRIKVIVCPYPPNSRITGSGTANNSSSVSGSVSACGPIQTYSNSSSGNTNNIPVNSNNTDPGRSISAPAPVLNQNFSGGNSPSNSNSNIISPNTASPNTAPNITTPGGSSVNFNTRVSE